MAPSSPPPVKIPYTQDDALSDIPGVSYALDTFLQSKMLESEQYCIESDPKMERMYFATGYGLIQCVKGLMSWEDEDILAAITHTKHGNAIASAHRKRAGLISTISQSVSAHSSTAFIKGMTDVERHAELTYAESLFEKALLGIVYSGDWLAFVKEALNMRTTIGIYRQLGAYLDEVDPDGTNPSIDRHFRSGVYLGVGMCNIILSLIPGKLATLVDLFGYHGDRTFGLQMLMRAGGWADSEKMIPADEEGVRRSICDMALLIFHLVLSSFTVEGIDISVARRILDWNLVRFPNGTFFLFGAGRLALVQSQPRRAIEFYTRAMQSQSQYRNLHHISYWECALARMALWELAETLGPAPEQPAMSVGGSASCWRILSAEATWSKSIYYYGLAACLLESWDTDSDSSDDRAKRRNEAEGLMRKVPGARQKIAGKSIPLEKFVARKSRKFLSQGDRLVLPALELAYAFQVLFRAPRTVLLRKMLPLVKEALKDLGVVPQGEAEAEAEAREQDTESTTDTTSVEPPKSARSVRSFVNVFSTRVGGRFASLPKSNGSASHGKTGSRVTPETYLGGGQASTYYDDLCLARFLEGVCWRFVAYPDRDAVPESDSNSESDSGSQSTVNEEISTADAETRAEEAFRAVFHYGPRIELDHYLVYHAHFEYGSLLACQGDTDGARREFELVLSGKPLEVNAAGRKGKYSMENRLHIRAHAALDALQSQIRNQSQTKA
ncbi:hypothetical protein H0H92_009003 [Tricholoma furcatifolium]|nr:hypothetical protein H0H92_009003 [Tricholoma furcatifolium]